MKWLKSAWNWVDKKKTAMFFKSKDLEDKAQDLFELGSKIVSMQKDLASERNIISILFDFIPALIFFKDCNNNIISINKYGAELWGADKDKILGDGWKSLASNEMINKYFQNDIEVIKTGKPKMNIVEPLVGDESRVFLTHKLPVRENGKIIGILGFSTEITEPLAGDRDARK